MVGGLEAESGTLTEKNVIRNIEIDTGNYKNEGGGGKKTAKTQARNSPRSVKRGNLMNEGKKSHITVQANSVSVQQPMLNQNTGDELPNNQQYQPSPGHGDKDSELPNYLLQTQEEDTQIALVHNSRFYRTNATTFTTS